MVNNTANLVKANRIFQEIQKHIFLKKLRIWHNLEKLFASHSLKSVEFPVQT